MENYSKISELDLSAIKPLGWLKHYLKKQRKGLTGHLEAAGSPFDRVGWGNPGIEIDYEAPQTDEWWPYEQTGYWIDGMVRCGYLLNDDFLIEKAMEDINYVLDNPDSDGYLGPGFLKKAVNWNRWVHAVFFRAVMAHYSATGDERVLPSLKDHYLSGTSPHREMREVCNVEVILWLYERTSDERLLKHAIEAYEGFNHQYSDNDTSIKSMLSDERSTEHGVTFNEIAKLGAIIYIYTGNERYLQATINAYKKLDRDQMLIDGVCSSSEHLRGKDPLDSHETCDIADYTWSLGYLLMATGESEYADKIERACFNAAPGAVTADFKALQYFSCPNQVVADKSSNHNKFYRGSKWMSYRPNPGTECCPGEVNRIMPNYVSRMWMKDKNGGLTACLYGPSKVSAAVGNGNQEVTIVQETNYPFSNQIDFKIETDQEVRFPLFLRIPAWCNKWKIIINGKEEEALINNRGFICIEKLFKDGDCITLVFSMEIKLSNWPKNGIGIERGPLVYSLKIDEDWQIDREEERCTEDFPAWNLYPLSDWNYALCLEEGDLQDVEIVEFEEKLDPWTIETAPIMLKVSARKIKGWNIETKSLIKSNRNDKTGLKTFDIEGNFLLTPQLPDNGVLDSVKGSKETITLVPYGCTKLRITIFPYIDEK
ncbi:MAG: beta-L-arabinofuranosidase domain-containing protein [Halothermotrichaceae bacterium]